MLRPWLAVALALAGCGDDDGAPAPNGVPTGRTPPPGGPVVTGPPKTQLAVKQHIEDRVACPRPDQPSDPKGGKCDLKAPSCGEHLYCLQLAQGSFCEPCPEREGIRHAFRERDFDPERNRDPFQPLSGSTDPKQSPRDVTPKCPHEDQLVASSYSYADLKLVGIVAQGTQRKVLMTMGKDGFIIKRGDCVGKEKVVVKDIGLGYVTFQGETDDVSVQLNPKQLLVNDPLLSAPRRTTIAPVPPPPPVPPARGLGGGASAAPMAPAVPGTAPAAPAAPPAGAATGFAPRPAQAPPAPTKP
jgi:hypothetical protein